MSINRPESPMKVQSEKPNRTILWLVLLLLAVCLGGAFVWWKASTDPRIILLQPDGNAEWICFDRPFDLVAWGTKGRMTEFRTSFELDQVPAQAVLRLNSLGPAAVYVNDRGNRLANPDDAVGDWDWRATRSVPLVSRLQPGRNGLKILSLRFDGPPAIIAHCEPLGLSTAINWEAKQSESGWQPATTVTTMRPTVLSRRFPATKDVFVPLLPWLLALFAVLFVGKLTFDRKRTGAEQPRSRIFSASNVRWGLIAGWLVLAINNGSKIPLIVGFDINEHVDYIQFVAENHTLPLASDGWQMFQSPFYYIISAIFYVPLAEMFDAATVSRLLRVIPLVCGVAQVELAYRAVKMCFPSREDLQSLGVLLGGLLPINLYMSQYVGNEPLAGFLTGVAVLLVMNVLHHPERARSRRRQILIGVTWGLAVLTKVTAVLLLLPMVFAIVTALRRGGASLRTSMRGLATIFATSALVSGWYFVRNWIEFGKLFVGGWDPARGDRFTWWQDPAYRTVGHFTNFGEALVRPIHSGFAGFWDSFYSTFWMDGYLSGMGVFEERPPWNESLEFSATWLALLPTLAILLGNLAWLRKSDSATGRSLCFAAASIAIYLAAMLYLFLQLPVASTAKASYTLGLIPCFAVLAAAGFDLLMRNRWLSALVVAGMGCWSIWTFAAFFVL